MAKQAMAIALLLTGLFLTPTAYADASNPIISARATATSTTCAADNCLRALSNAYTSTASAFCATYTKPSSMTTTPATTTSIPIPAYASSGCANNPSRVSSACTCLATSYGQPKPLHRVYGGTRGIDGTAYTVYDEALNIRSDDYPSGTYDEFLNRCRKSCGYYGNQCQTLSFVMDGYYLCYLYSGLFNASKLSYGDGYQRNVVEERYQS